MKKSELQKLIKEEVQKVLKEGITPMSLANELVAADLVKDEYLDMRGKASSKLGFILKDILTKLQ